MLEIEIIIRFRRLFDDTHDSLYDIVDVGEVALHLAVVEHFDGAVIQDGVGKKHGCHVRSAPRAVNGEKAQARGTDAVEMTVGMGHELVAFFRSRVEANGVVDAVAHLEGHRLVEAVDTGAAGVGEVFHFVVPARFENVGETGQVALDIGHGVFQRVAHTRLRGKVADSVEFFVFEKPVDRGRIGQVHPVEAMPLYRAFDFFIGIDRLDIDAQLFQSTIFQIDVIVVVDIVDTYDFVSVLQKFFCQMETDKSCGSGYEYFHCFHFLTS